MSKCKHCENEASVKGLCRNHYMQAWSRAHPESVRSTKAAYYENNKEHIKAKTAAYAKANLEQSRKYKRKWQERWNRENRDEVNHRTAAYRKANPEKVREQQKRSNAKHAERRREEHSSWLRRNPEMNAIYKGKRRQRMETSALSKELRAKVRAIYLECRRISAETGIKHHVDHIVPLARGGLHHPDNLQIITATLNLRKHAKLPEEFV